MLNTAEIDFSDIVKKAMEVKEIKINRFIINRTFEGYSVSLGSTFITTYKKRSLPGHNGFSKHFNPFRF